VSSASRLIGVAIAIPEPWGTELRRERARLGDSLADSVPTHVTLLPPSTIDSDVLPAVEAHLTKVAQHGRAFTMHLRGTGSFRPVSPVVFVQVVEGIAGCEMVEAEVRSGVLDRPLSFPYHPHVTVAHDLPEEALDAAFRDLAGYEARFPVWGFTLYEHVDGSWTPRRDFVFGGEARA
jgi:2'-5' RNA ligase